MHAAKVLQPEYRGAGAVQLGGAHSESILEEKGRGWQLVSKQSRPLSRAERDSLAWLEPQLRPYSGFAHAQFSCPGGKGGAVYTDLSSVVLYRGGARPAHSGDMLSLPAGDLQEKRVIGSGGFGVVYRARSRKLGMEVAVKILNRESW